MTTAAKKLCCAKHGEKHVYQGSIQSPSRTKQQSTIRQTEFFVFAVLLKMKKLKKTFQKFNSSWKNKNIKLSHKGNEKSHFEYQNNETKPHC